MKYQGAGSHSQDEAYIKHIDACFNVNHSSPFPDTFSIRFRRWNFIWIKASMVFAGNKRIGIVFKPAEAAYFDAI